MLNALILKKRQEIIALATQHYTNASQNTDDINVKKKLNMDKQTIENALIAPKRGFAFFATVGMTAIITFGGTLLLASLVSDK